MTLRVLWLVPVPLSLSAARDCTGGWLDTLATSLIQRAGVSLTVLWCDTSGEICRWSSADPPEQSPLRPNRRVLPNFVGEVAARMTGRSRQNRKRLDGLSRELAAAHYDILHIHGTESEWIREASQMRIPRVISIQGVLGDCAAGFWSGMPLVSRLLAPKLMLRWRDLTRRACVERHYLPMYGHFFCRTAYSARFVRALHPAAEVHEDGRILRPEFTGSRCWRPLRSDGRRMMATVSEQPYKGIHSLIPALGLSGLTDVELYVAGVRSESEYGRFLIRLATRLGVRERIHLLGRLGPRSLVERLLDMDLYVHPATQENSPNALAEAMALGLPCVVARAGGSAEYIEESVSGVSYDPTDLDDLRRQLLSVLDDRDRAAQFGSNAAAFARIRHAPERVAELTMRGYADVITSRPGSS